MSEITSNLGKFGNFNAKNTSISAVARTSDKDTMVANANTLDSQLFNMMPANAGVKCDVDSKNNLIVNKFKCNYPGNQTQPASGSIIAYRCTMPSDFSHLGKDPLTTTKPTTMYVPRGGWFALNVDSPLQKSIGNDSNIPQKDNLVFPGLYSNSNSNSNYVNVNNRDGTDLYILNENSTKDPNTWTKLKDLCIPGQ